MINAASSLPQPTLPKNLNSKESGNSLRENPSINMPAGSGNKTTKSAGSNDKSFSFAYFKNLPKSAIIGLVVLLVVVIGGGVALYLNQQSQDVRQQAAGSCAYNEIYCGGCINACRRNTKTCNSWITAECASGTTGTSGSGTTGGTTGTTGGTCASKKGQCVYYSETKQLVYTGAGTTVCERQLVDGKCGGTTGAVTTPGQTSPINPELGICSSNNPYACKCGTNQAVCVENAAACTSLCKVKGGEPTQVSPSQPIVCTAAGVPPYSCNCTNGNKLCVADANACVSYCGTGTGSTSTVGTSTTGGGGFAGAGGAKCGNGICDAGETYATCGDCGSVSTETTACGDARCPAGSSFACVSNQCINLTSNASNCGAVGFKCPTGNICVSGKCTAGSGSTGGSTAGSTGTTTTAAAGSTGSTGGTSTSTSTSTSTCSESPVNTQFRKTTGSDTPWYDGSAITDVTVGQKIDINCFSKNGAALLTGSNIYVKLPGSSTETKISSEAQLKSYEITQAGTYSFTCKSTSLTSCTNTDSITTLAAPANTSTPTSTTTTSGSSALAQAETTPTPTPSSVRTTSVKAGPTPVSGNSDLTFGLLIAGGLFILGGRFLMTRKVD